MDPSKIEFVKKRSAEILEYNQFENDEVFYHQPSAGAYGSQFAWDSGWSVIGASSIRPENALRELQTVFKLQLDSGRISHEIIIKKGNNSLSRRFITPLIAGQFDEKNRSLFIDPPSFLLAAEVLYNRTKDKRVLELLPSMEKCVNYLLEKRDLFGDGLVSIVHPWETGCDNAPYFDEPMNIKVNTPFWKLKYLIKYLKLIRELKKIDWNFDVVKEKNIFIMEDVGVNGLTAAGIVSLSNLYKEAGDLEKSEEYLSKAKKLINSIEKHLWVKSKGFFYPRVGIQNPKNILRSTAIGISPLLSGLVDTDKANSILENFLQSEEHFNSPYGVAFNSRSELEEGITFDTDFLWRGPCIWMNINWIAAKAADMYRRRDIAKEITKKTVKLLKKSDFREFYHPEIGIGGGAKNFTWGTVVLDMIKDYLN
ncbi:MAG: amylo-alpha-1,6-glucosidase [Promethearchaeota archaeon]